VWRVPDWGLFGRQAAPALRRGGSRGARQAYDGRRVASGQLRAGVLLGEFQLAGAAAEAGASF
jgi:hypothetical protein